MKFKKMWHAINAVAVAATKNRIQLAAVKL